MAKNLLNELKQSILLNGGLTVNEHLNEVNLSSGFMVSLAGSETILTNINDLTIKLLNKYKKIARSNNAFVGFWIDNNNLYVDVSINIINRAEALDIAKNNNQLAIFDLKNNSTIYLNNK